MDTDGHGWRVRFLGLKLLSGFFGQDLQDKQDGFVLQRRLVVVVALVGYLV